MSRRPRGISGRNERMENKTNVPLFTVAVVTYRQRHLLNECLDSIFQQDYSNIELIVCDDHSCDFECEEVRQYIDRHKGNNITSVQVYQHDLNVGTVKNCQKAFEMSHGTYLKLQAGDDMLAEENTLSDMAGLFQKKNCKLIFSRARGCTYEGERTENLYPPEDAFQQAAKCDAEKLFELIGTSCWGKYVNAPAVFWKREFLEQMGGFDLTYQYTEDWPMWLHVCETGECPRYVDKVTVLYRYGGISNSQPELNQLMAKAHYQESARMLREIAAAHFAETNNKQAYLKARVAAKEIEERGTLEVDWKTFSLIEKAEWKIKNISFYWNIFLLKSRERMFKYPLKKMLIWDFCITVWFEYQGFGLLPWWSPQIWAGLLLISWLITALQGCRRLIAESIYCVYALKRKFL